MNLASGSKAYSINVCRIWCHKNSWTVRARLLRSIVRMIPHIQVMNINNGYWNGYGMVMAINMAMSMAMVMAMAMDMATAIFMYIYK